MLHVVVAVVVGVVAVVVGAFVAGVAFVVAFVVGVHAPTCRYDRCCRCFYCTSRLPLKTLDFVDKNIVAIVYICC